MIDNNSLLFGCKTHDLDLFVGTDLTLPCMVGGIVVD